MFATTDEAVNRLLRSYRQRYFTRKPHICCVAGMYNCENVEADGYGKTPLEAYKAWAAQALPLRAMLEQERALIVDVSKAINSLPFPFGFGRRLDS